MFNRTFFILIICIFCFSISKASALTDNVYIGVVEKNLFAIEYKNELITNRLSRIESNIFGQKKAGIQQQRIQGIKRILGGFEPAKSQKIVANMPIKIIKPAQKAKPNPMERYPVIDEIEKKVLKKNFINENIYSRLDRLEVAIFNHKFQEPLNIRVDRLRATVLGNQRQEQSANKSSIPATDLSMTDENIKSILSRLEQETFKTTYESETVDARVSKLENSVFSETSPEDPIEDRVDRLAAVVGAQPSNELYKDMSKLRQYQTATQQVTAAALLIMIIKGLLF